MADLDALYGLPLEEFTPARDAAAKEIRKAGDRETAAIVAKLSKPTPAAWTANQVAREQPELIEALLEAGDAVREAQEAAVSGAGGRGLRDATLQQRKAVDAVMDAAATYKPGGKPLSGAMADRLRTTLNAVAGDEALREALSEGRLTGEAQAGGAWPFALEALPAVPKPKPAAKKKPAARRSKDEQAAEREAKAREAAEQAERERAEKEARKALEKELRDARSSLRVRERVLAGAEEDANDAAGRIGDAQDALEAAQQALEDAKSEAEAAQKVLGEARNALSEARDRVAALEERLD
jgi:hypothetical protein